MQVLIAQVHVQGERRTAKPTEGKSTHNTRKQMLYEYSASEALFPSYELLTNKENVQCPTGASMQNLACLNRGRLTRSKIPGVVLIISNPVCFVVARPMCH